MNLLDSLLDAIVRLDGDALVMHVGEKPYVVTTSEAVNQFRGPLAWGQVELSTRVLTTDAVSGMLGQILPLDQRSALDDFGATEYEVTATNHADEKFTIVAARGGDDIWVEMRRHPRPEAQPAAVAPAVTEHPAAVQESPAVHSGDPAAVAVVPAQEPETMGHQNQIETEAAAEDVAADTFALEVAPDSHIDGSIELPTDIELPAIVIQPPAVTLPGLGSDIDPLEIGDTVPSFELPSLREAASLPQPPGFDGDLEPELATDMFGLDRDIDSGILSQDWAEDLMTEGELGELLRATAAAAITDETLGRQDLDEENRQAFRAATLESDVVSVDPLVDHLNLSELEVDEPEASVEVVVSADAVVARETVELPLDVEVPVVNADEGHHVSRETRELAALVAYQMERDRDAEQPAAPEPASAPIEPVEAVAASAAEPTPHEPLPPTRIEEPLPNDRVDEPSHGPAAEESEPAQPIAAELREEEHVAEEPQPMRPAAVVLPLTRPTKIEAGPDNRAAAATTLQRLLRLASARGAATVYVVANAVPLVRVDGEFATLEGEPAISGALVERLLAEVAPGGRGQTPPTAEWLIDIAEIGRVRCLAFRDHRGTGIIFRMVPQRSISADQLGLSAEVQALCSEADGLVLVTGGRGSGKSTLLTSFVDLINRTRSDHIITTESQIEFVHESKRSFVSQREVRGEDAMAASVRAACREEADVLIIEDIRTHELASLALEAAESGRLVFGSVPGLSTSSAVERLIDLFPAERREKAQATLAGVLRGIVSQVLLRKLRGGRVAAREVLLNTPAVASLILEGKTFQLPGAIENGRRDGMTTFADSLAALVREGTVHPAHAYRKAPNREQFLAALRRDGIDTSVAERLG